MKKKNILLVAESDSTNLGDKLISELFYELCKKNLTETDIKEYPISYARRFFFVKVIYKIAYWLRLYFIYEYAVRFVTYLCVKNKINKDTIVVFSGGQMFINYFIDPIISILRCAKKKNAKIYFNACGSGDISPYYKKELSKIINIANVSLRDNVNNFKKIAPNAYYRPDVAIATSKILPPPMQVSENQVYIIGWGVINTGTYNFWNKATAITDEWYLKKAREAIIQIIKNENCKIEIFTNGDEGDYKLAIKLKEQLSDYPQVHLAERPINVNMLLNMINKYTYVIASRMHALIIAYSYGIPYIALRWENKINDFAEQTDCLHRVYDISDMGNIDWNKTIIELKENGIKLDLHGKLQKYAVEGLDLLRE